jgi:Fe-S-cluster-containing dehydrogenase component
MPTTVEVEKIVTNTVVKDVNHYDGLKQSIGRIIHNQDLCSGCRLCQIVCSTYHEGVSSPALSRLQYKKYELGGYITDVFPCKQCDGPECLYACPTGALHVDTTTGARVVDPDVCIGCQMCINACPVVPPRIRFNAAKNIAFKCDLCGGDPQCVKFCPMGALTASWIEVEDTGEEDEGIIEEVITGNAAILTHFRGLELSEIENGLLIKGTLWTSHCSHSTVVYGIFNIWADFYDAQGTLLGTSDTATIQLAEMLSQNFELNFNTSLKMEDVARVVVTVEGTEVYAGQEGN